MPVGALEKPLEKKFPPKGPHDIVISDVGAHKMWIARHYNCYEPNTCIISNGFATMGIGVPGAIAAKLINPDKKVLAIVGDGSFMMNNQELETALRIKTPIVVLIFNDSNYGLIKWKQEEQYGKSCYVNFTNPDFVKLAESMYAKGYRVEKAEDLISTLEKAFKQNVSFKFFATSSIDALIHSIESSVSPKATSYTEMFSYKAMEMILKGYQEIAKNGPDARFSLLNKFLLASNYAGIAFGNAGCGAVHAMSYPLGANYHVPHGESNYQMFIGVFKTYYRLKPQGKITKLNKFLASILNCKESEVYTKIEELLNVLIPKKQLREYGVKEDELKEFTQSVMTKQGRLMANNYTELNEQTVYEIYKSLY